MNDSTLQIVLQAVDNASKTLQQVADNVDKLSKTTNDNAEASGKASNAFEDMAKFAAVIGLERLTEEFISLTKEAVNFAVETSTAFETSKAQFDVLLGSAQAGSAMLAQIAKYEPNTSFDFSQLTNATQQLLALGVAQKEVIPDLKMLGDVSLGNVDHLNHLAYTFGQVKDQTKLSAMQVREFVQGANVDILQLLTNYLNAHADAYNKVAVAAGGAAVAVGKHGKSTKDTALEIATLNQHITQTQEHLKILQEEHAKSGVATDKHNLAIMKANDTLTDYKTKLADATKATQATSGALGNAGKLNAEEVRQMITDGKISFADVQGALQQSTEKGGMYFQAMQKHMGTFSGILSSTRTQIQQTALEIMGFDMNPNSKNFGELKDGTPFAMMKDGLQQFLDFLKGHKEEIAQFFQNAFTDIKIFAQFLDQNRPIIIAFAGALTGILAIGFIAAAAALISFIGLSAPLIGLFAGIGAGVALLGAAWATNFGGMKTTIDNFIKANQQTFQAFWIDVRGVFTFGLGFIKGFWQTTWQGLAQILTGIWELIKGVLEVGWGALEVILNVGMGVFTGNWTKAWEGIKKGFGDIWNGIKDVFHGIWDAIVGDLKTYINTFIGLINGMIGGINAVGSKIPGNKISIPQLPHLASGTDFFGGGLAVVGENGPELVNLPRSSQVIPHSQVNNYANRNASVTIQNVNVRNDMDIDTMVRRLTMQLKFNTAI